MNRTGIPPARAIRAAHTGWVATRAVADVSLGVAKGEFVTLLGPSGCGKTTLLNLIPGFLEPDGGEILIETFILADDEIHLADDLQRRLARLWPELDIVAVLHDGPATVTALLEQRPDVAFLDIRMPGLPDKRRLARELLALLKK